MVKHVSIGELKARQPIKLFIKKDHQYHRLFETYSTPVYDPYVTTYPSDCATFRKTSCDSLCAGWETISVVKSNKCSRILEQHCIDFNNKLTK
jgi:hypothetical protein